MDRDTDTAPQAAPGWIALPAVTTVTGLPETHIEAALTSIERGSLPPTDIDGVSHSRWNNVHDWLVSQSLATEQLDPSDPLADIFAESNEDTRRIGLEAVRKYRARMSAALLTEQLVGLADPEGWIGIDRAAEATGIARDLLEHRLIEHFVTPLPHDGVPSIRWNALHDWLVETFCRVWESSGNDPLLDFMRGQLTELPEGDAVAAEFVRLVRARAAAAETIEGLVGIRPQGEADDPASG